MAEAYGRRSLAAGAMAAIGASLCCDKTTCGLCPVTIEKSLEKVTGVSAVTVDFPKKTATITYDPDKTTPDALSKATTDAGYPSTMAQ